MRVLDVLNLNLRELNHHEEVYSQEAIREAACREQAQGVAGCAASPAGQPAIGIAASLYDRASAIVDRGPAGRTVATVR